VVTPRRGEIWWVRQPVGPGQAGDAATARRPYLVVSADPWNGVEAYPRITLCPLTGAEHVPRRYDTDVVIKKREAGIPKDSVIRCVEIYTVFRDLLIDRVGQLTARRMAEVDRALALYLALSQPGAEQ
jgi:mRNA interferase MazF